MKMISSDGAEAPRKGRVREIRARKTLSHRWSPRVGGDGTTMELPLDRLLFNIAHILK
jgi:hypothetical protein